MAGDFGLGDVVLYQINEGERGGSVVVCRTPEREVGGSIPTAAVLCPDMTEKLLTGTLSLNTNKQKINEIHLVAFNKM